MFNPNSALSVANLNVSQFYNTSSGSADISAVTGAPFGFFHRPIMGYAPGFPVYFDIDATEDRSQMVLQYLRDGQFLDERTLSVSVELMAYNPVAFTVYYSRVDLTFTSADVEVVANTYSVLLEDPNAQKQQRTESYGMNAGLTVIAAYLLYKEGESLAKRLRDPSGRWRSKSAGKRFFKLVRLANALALCAAMVLFWAGLVQEAQSFAPFRNYAVYDQLDDQGRILLGKRSDNQLGAVAPGLTGAGGAFTAGGRAPPHPPPPPPPALAAATAAPVPRAISALLLDDPFLPPRWAFRGDSSGLDELASTMSEVRVMSEMNQAFWALQALNVALLVLRTFVSLNFHAKIGLASRAVAYSMHEMIDFIVVATITTFFLSFLVMFLFGRATCRATGCCATCAPVFVCLWCCTTCVALPTCQRLRLLLPAACLGHFHV